MIETERQPYYFCCEQCAKYYPVDPHVISEGGCSFACLDCQAPISIHNLLSKDGICCWELLGVRYEGIRKPDGIEASQYAPTIDLAGNLNSDLGSWIRAEVSQLEPEMPQATESIDQNISAAFDEMVQTWTVETADGDVKSYPSFTAIRDALVAKQLSKKDFILSAEGDRLPLESFTGIRDLYSHSDATSPRRRPGKGIGAILNASNDPKKTRRRHFILRALLASVLFGGAGYLGLLAKSQWQLYQGRDVIKHLMAQSQAVPAQFQLKSALEEAQTMLQENPVKQASQGRSLMLKALKQDPNHPQVLSYLSQFLLEEAGGTQGPGISQAKTLLNFLEASYPKNILTAQAKARWLWRQQKSSQALAVLKDGKQLQFSFLRVHIYLGLAQKGDALLELSQVLKFDPSHQLAISLVADLLQSEGKNEEAASYQDRLVRLEPSLENKTKLMNLLRLSGDRQGLQSFFESYANDGPDQIEYEYLRFLVDQEAPQEVVQRALAFKDKYPDSPYQERVNKFYQDALNPSNLNEPAASPSERRRRRR